MTNLHLIVSFVSVAIATANHLNAPNLRGKENGRMLFEEAALLESFFLTESDSQSRSGLGIDDSDSDFNDLDDFIGDGSRYKNPIAVFSSTGDLDLDLDLDSSTTSDVADPATHLLKSNDTVNSTTSEIPVTKSGSIGIEAPDSNVSDTEAPNLKTSSSNSTWPATSGSNAVSGFDVDASTPDVLNSSNVEIPTNSDMSTSTTTKVSTTKNLTLDTPQTSFSDSTEASGSDASTFTINETPSITDVPSKGDDPTSNTSNVPATVAPTPPSTANNDISEPSSTSITPSSNTSDLNPSTITPNGSVIEVPTQNLKTSVDSGAVFSSRDSKNISDVRVIEIPAGNLKTNAPYVTTAATSSDVSVTASIGIVSGTSISAPINSSPSSEMPLIQPWNQCGGSGFDYSKYLDDGTSFNWSTKLSCAAGFSCEEVDVWYFQCQPVIGLAPLEVWDQCGGVNHIGSTECTTGSICKYVNEWYSQCVPAQT
ncbi:putative Cellulose-binding domain, fungal, Cellulose-binding domain superfamily [Plasmopara halstedii]